MLVIRHGWVFLRALQLGPIRGFEMVMRPSILLSGLVASWVAAGSAAAETMNVEAARRFVLGKLFAYSCFDGTRGTGRIYGDGSAVGTIQVGGAGPVRYAMLPPGTLRVRGEAVCASFRGMSMEPCFNLNKTDAQSFRGSVSGLGILYCDFTRRPEPVHTTWRVRPATPVPLDAGANAAAGSNGTHAAESAPQSE
jgi:hypothetical protein